MGLLTEMTMFLIFKTWILEIKYTNNEIKKDGITHKNE